jgi:hypothetical protein
MDNAKFVLCLKCGAVHHVTPFDRAPMRAVSLEQAREPAADDWRIFMDQHAGHALEPLTALGEQRFPEGSASDPMAVAYLRVTNGRREFLLRRSRRSITEPVRFEPVEGSLTDELASLEIQEREIRKELKLRFRADGAPLSDAKVDLFIDLFRAAAGRIDAARVSAAELSYENDNIAYAALAAPTQEALLRECAGRFTSGETKALRQFIETHSGGSDVMTLVLRRRVVLAQPF